MYDSNLFSFYCRGLFPDLGAYKHAPARAFPLTKPLGMDQLPRQKHLKTKRKPFQLNVMVVGKYLY